MGVLFVLCVSACTTYQHTARRSAIRLHSINSHEMTTDMRVDFLVKVQGESRHNCRSRQEAISEALFNAIQTCKVDVVVDPIYEIEVTTTITSTYYAKVVGFAGYYIKAEVSDDVVKEVQKAAELQMNDVVKYKLLTDPNFVDQYYQNEKQDNSTTIYLNNGNGSQQVTNDAKGTTTHKVATPAKKGQNENKKNNVFSKLKEKLL